MKKVLLSLSVLVIAAVSLIVLANAAFFNGNGLASELDEKNKPQSFSDETSCEEVTDADTGYAVLRLFNSVLNAAYDSETDSFTEIYGGAYVDENGRLNLLYCGEKEEFINWLASNKIKTDNVDVVFTEAEIPYNYLYNVKKQLDDRIDKISVANKVWKGHPYLPLAVRVIYINDQSNSVHVVLDRKKVSEVEIFPNWPEPMYFVGEEEDKHISVEYVEASEIELFSADADTVHSGQAIYTGGAFRESIGIRAQYIGSDNQVSFGFLTAGHSFFFDNQEVYLLSGNTYTRIGELKWRKTDPLQGIDAAFVALDSSYSMSDTVYYSSYYPITGEAAFESENTSFSGNDTIYYRNCYLNIPRGYHIYTNGSTTGKTSGRMISFDTTIVLDDTLVWHHFGMVTNRLYYGDSGGLVYSNDSGDGVYDSYITVGMVEAGDVENWIYIISTAKQLFDIIENHPELAGDIAFLTIY